MEKIKIIVNGFDHIGIPFNMFSSANIEIDTKSFLGQGSEHYASPLSEYEMILLDFNGVEAPIVQNRIEQLRKFLKDGKILIYILRKFYKKPSTGVSNYHIIKELFGNDLIFNKTDFGTKYSLTPFGNNSIYKDYLSAIDKTYTISLLESQSKDYISLADNTEERSVAFIRKDLTNVIFLPWLQDNKEKFWETSIKLLLNNIKSGEPIAEWVNQYSFKELQDANIEIGKIQNEINTLEEKKKDFNFKKENYEKIRDPLLFRDGRILEEVCKEVFIFLGLNVMDGTVGHEDLIIEYNEKLYLIEVKGSKTSASKNNVRQLNSHITEYENANEIKVKGILLINAWRELPIEQRNNGENKIFPDNIMNLVGIAKVALMTTQQLFVAYCQKLESKFNLEKFIEAISKEGIITEYNNIQDYKLNESN